MSPRSEEFLEEARRRVETARAILEVGDPASVLSVAYYAMLNAARAALSEENENARTHRGTWMLFRERFVVPGRFDEQLFRRARQMQEAREAADYRAVSPSSEAAREAVADAERFVAAVSQLLDA